MRQPSRGQAPARMIAFLIAEGGRSLAAGFAACGRVAVMRRKLSPREIVERLQTIEALAAEGLPLAGALRLAGLNRVEYERWRVEYGGLRRTLGPLLRETPKRVERTRRGSAAHPPKPL